MSDGNELAAIELRLMAHDERLRHLELRADSQEAKSAENANSNRMMEVAIAELQASVHLLMKVASAIADSLGVTVAK